MTLARLLSASVLTSVLAACSSPGSSDTPDAASAIDATTDPFDAHDPFDSSQPFDAPAALGQWARPYGTAATDFMRRLVVASDRSVVVLGSIGGTTTANDRMVKLDAEGHEVWARALPAGAIALDAANDVYVMGPLVGTLDIDGHMVTAPSAAPATYLARLDGDTGTGQWAVVLADRWLGMVADLVVNPDGSTIAVVGTVNSTVNLGGDTLTTFGHDDIVVAMFDGAGAHRWSRHVGGPNSELPHDIALTADGGVVVCGEYGPDSDLGGGVLSPHGNRDAFVARYRGSDGAHQWSFGHGGPDNRDFLMSLAVDGNALYAVGSFGATASFGGTSRTAVGQQDAILVRYDATTGAHVWTNSFGGEYADGLFGVGVIGDQIAFGGSFNSSVQIGSTLLVGNGGVDIVIGRADAATGAFGHAAGAGGVATDKVEAFGALGNDVWTAGWYSGPAYTLFGAPLPASVGMDAFIGRTTL